MSAPGDGVMIRDDYAGVGWSEGIAMLGLADVGIEWDAAACATRAACGHRTIRADLTHGAPITDRPWAGYIASPPCQTFSTAGAGEGRALLDQLCGAVRRRDWSLDGIDDRTAHVLHTARTALSIGARWIALEQVPAVLPVWEALAFELHCDGWSTWTGVLNAADYGVPQTRRRAILCASRDRVVHRPAPTHTETPGMFGESRWVSWGEALGVVNADLETVRGAGMTARHGSRPTRPADEPAPTIRAGLGGIGTGLRIRGSDRSNATTRAHTEPAPTVMFGHAGMFIDRHTNSTGAQGVSYPTSLRGFNRPSPTVTVQAGTQWIRQPATTIGADPRMSARGHHEHGEQGRDARTVDQVTAGDYDGTQPIKLSIAQAACLQSFRPDLPWQGTKTEIYRQIGNAVPPLLAAHIVAMLTGKPAPAAGTPRLTWQVAS